MKNNGVSDTRKSDSHLTLSILSDRPSSDDHTPLHEFVYRKITAYVKKAGKKGGDLIFHIDGRKTLGSNIYNEANAELAKYTGYSGEQLEKENITFYSGRHFWKTLMDSENLGDVEEYFMGHKVSADVAKRYNHRDK